MTHFWECPSRPCRSESCATCHSKPHDTRLNFPRATHCAICRPDISLCDDGRLQCIRWSHHSPQRWPLREPAAAQQGARNGRPGSGHASGSSPHGRLLLSRPRQSLFPRTNRLPGVCKGHQPTRRRAEVVVADDDSRDPGACDTHRGMGVYTEAGAAAVDGEYMVCLEYEPGMELTEKVSAQFCIRHTFTAYPPSTNPRPTKPNAYTRRLPPPRPSPQAS
jgi:hypothetical protein